MTMVAQDTKIAEIDDNNDIIIRINTLTENEARVVTEKITGTLDSIILSVDKQANILIRLAEHPNIVLFEEVSYHGVDYLPLRTEARSDDNKIFNYSPQTWNLNNKLEILVSGTKNTNVEIIMRLK